jgi:cytochrome c-type biogenesis protein CcmH
MAAVAAVLVVMPTWSFARAKFGRATGAIVVVTTAAIPVIVALILYGRWGTPQSTALATVESAPGPHSMAAGANAMPAEPAGSLADVTVKLAARLASAGGSAADWQLLAASYTQQGQITEAAVAQAKANELAGKSASSAANRPAPPLDAKQLALLEKAEKLRRARDFTGAIVVYKKAAAANGMSADAWANYADALASTQKGRLSGEPMSLVDHALELDPAHAKALWLKASALHEQGRNSEALAFWQRLAAVVPADSPDRKIIDSNMAEARELASGSAPQTAAAAAATPGISGEVDVDKKLRGRMAKGMTLFVFAKAPASPGPPLAVLRTAAGQWPVKFSLDDSNAMLPGRNISAFSAVRVEARLSASGQALPQSGDLQGSSATLDPKSNPSVHLVINQVVP